ncbi:ABC transporter substrate-binding protein [Kallotenue papyrolyticum]|uniref:ABC transporter substrate-binding protein n=1 Tax=Kallotenue papyrolyticum TaxID=1325125 RepID=UPI00047859A1|nr:iron-siderophore ABC transporter substrate-binding protein [Kallotenue papyrolyticum]
MFIARLRPALLGSALLISLVACGPAAAPSASAPSPTPASSPAPASEAPATSDAPAADATRLIRHAMGETRVPRNPQRVVVLDTGELDSVLALGITPVGAVEALPGMGFQAYFGERTAGITTVGTIAEPDLETILRLKPDLIISNKVRHEAIYEQLAQIAPTVFAERVGVVWKDNFKLHAAALGKSDVARQIEARYQARVAQLRQQLGDPAAISVSVVRFLEGQVRQYQRGSFIGTLLDDVGVARPAAQQLSDKTWTEVNRELIPQLDADVLFVTHYGPADQTPKREFESDALWAQLQVVQRDRVYEVSDDHWMLGLGYLAAERVLDDLEQYLLP